MKKYKSARIIIIMLIIIIFGINSYSNAVNETATDGNNTANTQENTSNDEKNNNTQTNENTNTNTDSNVNKDNTTTTEPEKQQESKPEEQPEQETEQKPEKEKETEQENQPEKEQNNQQNEEQEKTPQQQRTTTQTETKKSSNANLANLGITPNDFKGFNENTLEYTVTVPNDVEKINVYAELPKNSKAEITSGTGVQNLNVGVNACVVTVTAEDGTKKVYTIKVTREEAKQDEKKEENANSVETSSTKSVSDLKKLEVKGYTLSPGFSANVYEYKLNVNKDVSSLEIVTEGANDKVSIDVVGNTDLQDGENTITILVKNSQTNKNTTYQILVNKGEQKATNLSVKRGSTIRTILIGLFVIIVIAIVLTFIIMNRKQDDDEEIQPRKIKSKKEYIDDEDDGDYVGSNERLNLDDEKELFKRVNKSDFKHVEDDERRNITIEKKKSNTSTNTKTIDEYFKDSNNQKGRHF